jgi:hypothetical protein
MLCLSPTHHEGTKEQAIIINLSTKWWGVMFHNLDGWVSEPLCMWW